MADKELLQSHGIKSFIKIKLVRIQLLQSRSFTTINLSITPSENPNSTSSVCPHPKCFFKCRQKSTLETHIKGHKQIRKLVNEEYLNHISKDQAKNVSQISLNPNNSSQSPWIHCSYKNCKYKTKKLVTYKSHLATIHNLIPFKCQVCGKYLRSNWKLKRHLSTHSSDKKIACSFPQCTYKCHRLEHLKQHYRIHTGERPYKCKLCKRKFSNQANLKVHGKTHLKNKDKVSNELSPTASFECPTCDYTSSSIAYLKAHIRKHNGERPFICGLCNFSTHDQNTLTCHIMKHTGEKPFACSKCDYHCTKKSILNSHMLTHKRSKPYKCNVKGCNFATKSMQRLKNHLFLHTGEKPWICSVCDSSFALNQYLQLHMRIHTGVKPYECSQCDYRATFNNSLLRHIRFHHSSSSSSKSLQSKSKSYR